MLAPKKIVQLIGLILLAIVMSVLLFVYNPSDGRLFPPCPLHKLTGLYCPGCGSLRALHQLLHGHIITAFGLNCLMVLTLPFIIYGLLAQGLRYFFNIRIPVMFIPAPWIWTLFGLIILYTILRNIPVAPFSWLAP